MTTRLGQVVLRATLCLVASALVLSACTTAKKRTASPTTVARHTEPFADLVARVRSGVIRIEAETCDASGVGTGFLISPRHVATVEHVVDGATQIVLKQNGRRVGTGTVIGTDTARDLALVRTNKRLVGYKFKLAARAPRLGEAVAAIGFPLALPLTVTRGSVSGLQRSIPIKGITRRRLVQTDAAVNPGNSGGPLLNADTGQVVGLVDLGTNEANGIAFAVSAQVAKPLLGAWSLSPQEVAAPSCVAVPPTFEAAPPAPPSGGEPSAAMFSGAYFSIDYPDRWKVESSEASKGSYLDTTIRDPEHRSLVLRVDVTPGVGGDPVSASREVVNALRRSPGYQELDLSRTTFQGYDALQWEFLVREDGVLMHKLDIFLVSDSGDEFAVLTQAPQSIYGDWSDAFDAIRDSLIVNG